MIKPLNVTGAEDYVLTLHQGFTLKYKTLLTSRWESVDHHQGQVIVNFLPQPQTCSVDCRLIYSSPDAQGEKYTGTITIPPLSAVWVE